MLTLSIKFLDFRSRKACAALKQAESTLPMGMQTVQPLWNTAWWFSQKLKIESPNDPAISILGIDFVICTYQILANEKLSVFLRKQKHYSKRHVTPCSLQH